MPRQSRGRTPARSAPSRPTAAPARPPQQPSRPTSTAAAPTATQQAPAAGQQQSGGSGLFGQMASTAAGVAVGSSIGHAIGGFFGGGGSSQPAEANPADNSLSTQQYQGQTTTGAYGRGCETDAKAFTKCLDENKGDYQMSVCGWYLDQLKACQSAASQY